MAQHQNTHTDTIRNKEGIDVKKKDRNQKKMTRGFVSDLKNIQQGNMYCTKHGNNQKKMDEMANCFFFLSFLTGRMKWKYREILGIISPIFLPGDAYFFIELNTSFDDTIHISAQKIKYKREK